METSGMVRISLLPGGEAGWCYYSEPVVLMPEEGDLWIDLALVTSDGQVIFGDMGPFTDCEYTEEPVQAEIGALLDPSHSAFRVGVRLKEDTEAEEVFVRWRAVRMAPLGGGDAGPKAEEKEEKRPDPTFYIEAVPGSIHGSLSSTRGRHRACRLVRGGRRCRNDRCLWNVYGTGPDWCF